MTSSRPGICAPHRPAASWLQDGHITWQAAVDHCGQILSMPGTNCSYLLLLCTVLLLWAAAAHGDRNQAFINYKEGDTAQLQHEVLTHFVISTSFGDVGDAAAAAFRWPCTVLSHRAHRQTDGAWCQRLCRSRFNLAMTSPPRSCNLSASWRKPRTALVANSTAMSPHPTTLVLLASTALPMRSCKAA